MYFVVERLIYFSVTDYALMYDLLIELFGERAVFLFDVIQVITVGRVRRDIGRYEF